MPVISCFLGIIIKMYFGDHLPKHFHVEYNEYEAMIDIESFEVIKGKVPQKVLSLVKEWADLHKEELLENWQKASKHQPVKKIKGLV